MITIQNSYLIAYPSRVGYLSDGWGATENYDLFKIFSNVTNVKPFIDLFAIIRIWSFVGIEIGVSNKTKYYNAMLCYQFFLIIKNRYN